MNDRNAAGMRQDLAVRFGATPLEPVADAAVARSIAIAMADSLGLEDVAVSIDSDVIGETVGERIVLDGDTLRVGHPERPLLALQLGDVVAAGLTTCGGFGHLLAADGRHVVLATL